MSPLVDVLLPTFKPNRAHLTEALESLLKQEFQDWHAFVHDDFSHGSETAAIVKPFLSDPRFTFAASNRQLGIGGNWNACIEQTSAPFVAFLFQDDLWSPSYLSDATSILKQHPTVGFVSMRHEYRSEGDIWNFSLYEVVQSFKEKNIAAGVHSGRELLRFWINHELHPNIIGEPSFVVMRRETMRKAGSFLEDMPQFLDTEFWQRLLLISDCTVLSTKNYGVFRVHPEGASAVNQEMGSGLFDRLRCFERLISALQGDDRKACIRARNRAVSHMVEKFFSRVKSGKKASPKGSSMLVRFCIRHPVLIGKSVLKYFWLFR